MDLQGMFDRVILNSGQFQISQDHIELDIKKFKLLVEVALGFYSNNVPHVAYLYVNGNNTNSRQIHFQESDYPLGVPDMIVDLIPIRISGVIPYYLREFDRPRSNLDIKVEFPWIYRKPTLTIPTNAEFDVKAAYYHRLVNTGNDKIPHWDCRTITDNDDSFIDLLTGRFLKAVGRARNAFTIGDLPIKADSSELISEGKELEKQAKEEIQTIKKLFAITWG
jgi:hypothetical protein